MPRMLPDRLVKFGALTIIADEQLFTLMAIDKPEYIRGHTETIVPPTPSAWNLYRKAVRGLKDLEAYDGTDWGGPDYGTEVHPPRNTRKIEFTETHEEWMARCQALRKAEGA